MDEDEFAGQGFKSSFGDDDDDEFADDPLEMDAPDMGLDEEDPDKDS